jgi:2'-5' RNA ligase
MNFAAAKKRLIKRMYAEPKDPEPEPRHDYSSTQVNITGRPAQIMRKLAAKIPDSELAEDGRESEFHITCRWGLHFQTPSKKLRSAIASFGPIRVTLGKTSLFSNDDADVLKVDVDSPDLHRLYNLIGRTLPVHTTFPKYIPHATIAYLKSGKGTKYAGSDALSGINLTFDHVSFSGKNGHREDLPLTTAKQTYRAL